MSPKPWYNKGLRFECTRCGACCQTHGEYSHLYMEEVEIEAMARHLGLTPADFRARYCTEEDGWTVLQPGHQVCPFLGEGNRCQVYPVRPMQCRTWPFWEDNLKTPAAWKDGVESICPGAGEGPLYPAEEVERIARQNEEWYG